MEHLPGMLEHGSLFTAFGKCQFYPPIPTLKKKNSKEQQEKNNSKNSLKLKGAVREGVLRGVVVTEHNHQDRLDKSLVNRESLLRQHHKFKTGPHKI